MKNVHQLKCANIKEFLGRTYSITDILVVCSQQTIHLCLTKALIFKILRVLSNLTEDKMDDRGEVSLTRVKVPLSPAMGNLTP